MIRRLPCLTLAAALCLAPAAARALEAATPGYTDVQQAFLREDFFGSAQLANRFLAQHPDAAESSRVSIWLAISLDRLQRTNEALGALEQLKLRLPAKDSRWPEVYYWEGDISRRAGQLVRARQAFQRLLDRDPASAWAPQARLGLGLISLSQQAYAAGAATFHDVATRYPDAPAGQDARLFEGLCLLQLQRNDDAVASLRPLSETAKDPSVASQAAMYLGEALTGLGKFPDAVQAYRRARELSPQSTWSGLALFGLGWAEYRLGRCQDSIDAFSQFLALRRPEHHTEALFAQAACLLQLDREPEALSRFEQIAANDPHHPLAFDSQLAVIDAYQHAGRYGAAKDAVHRLLSQVNDDGKRAQLQVRLGGIALATGNAVQAQTVYALAVEAPDAATRQAALNGLGDVHLFLGQPQEAEGKFRKALEAGPGAQADYARYQLGRIQLQRGRYSDAAAVFQDLIAGANGPLADDARLALALTSLQQGDTKLARSQLDVVRQAQNQNTPLSARAAYYLALVAIQEEDETAARHYCQEAIDRAPRSDESVDARLLMADLLSRQTSTADAMDWLRLAYQTSDLPRRHRAKLAKRLADFARQEGAFAEALRWYDEAERLLPALRGEIAYRVASCYEEAGDVDTAIARYQSIRQPPWRVRAQLALAKLLEREGRIPAAERVYEGLADEPSPEARSAKERLAVLRGQAEE